MADSASRSGVACDSRTRVTPRVITVDPRTSPEWLTLASSHESASLFNSPRWIGAISDTYGFVPTARVLIVDNQPVAGVSWSTIDDVRGERRVSMPFSDWSDPLVDSAEHWLALSSDLIDPDGVAFMLRSRDVEVASLDGRLSGSSTQMWHGTTVLEPAEQDRRISARTRRDIGVAERSGLTASAESDWSVVAEFHRAHVELRRSKYGMLAQPVRLFEALWNRFPVDHRWVIKVSSADGEGVAFAVLFRWRDVVYFKFSASNQTALTLRPNDLLYRSVIAHAHSVGARLVDWGLSDCDQPGLLQFKRKWADLERPLFAARCGQPSARADVGQLLGTITGLLTDPGVPTDVVTRAGDELYRFFA
jgi:CelD/BcsL family acetyltransferase involved in cellulose biosynthesis